eukprot:TRINITY_DN3786_c0_g1_i3.p1 TRINITY_DN3786_c0_g1~~TRINITY_DN3786_c0_g1_i3.p1  ORF type:complete len:1870 (-),score=539.39 TRINITY_DN3786_c0_g1_i3:92-5701(-)
MSARQRKASSVGNLVARFEGLQRHRSRTIATIPKPWDKEDLGHPLAASFARWWRVWQQGKRPQDLESILAQRRTCQGEVEVEESLSGSLTADRPVPGKLNLAEVTAPLQMLQKNLPARQTSLPARQRSLPLAAAGEAEESPADDERQPVPGKLNLAEVTAPLQMAWTTAGLMVTKALAPVRRSRTPAAQSRSQASLEPESAPTCPGHVFHPPKDGVLPSGGRLRIGKVKIPEGLLAWKMPVQLVGPACPNSSSFAHGYVPEVPKSDRANQGQQAARPAPMFGKRSKAAPPPGPPPPGKYGKAEPPPGPPPPGKYGKAAPPPGPPPHGKCGKGAPPPGPPPPGKFCKGAPPPGPPPPGKYGKAAPPPGPPPAGKFGKGAPPPGPPPPSKHGLAASSCVLPSLGEIGKAAHSPGPIAVGKNGKGVPPPGPPPPGKNGKAASLPKHSLSPTPMTTCKGMPPGPPPPPKSAKAAQLQGKSRASCPMSESSGMSESRASCPMSESSVMSKLRPTCPMSEIIVMETVPDCSQGGEAASVTGARAGSCSPSPTSNAVFQTAEPVEAFGLEENDATFHTAEGAEGLGLADNSPGVTAKDTALELIKSAQAFLLDHGLPLAKQGRKQTQPSSERVPVRMHSSADTDSDGEESVRANNASDVLAAAKVFSKGFGNADYFRCLASGAPDVFSASLRSEFWLAPPGVCSRPQSCDLSEATMSMTGLLQPCPEGDELDKSAEQKKAVHLQLPRLYAGAAKSPYKKEALNTPAPQNVLAASLQEELDASMAKLAAVEALLEEQCKQLQVEKLCKQELLEQLSRRRPRPRSLSSVGFECSESLAEAQKALEMASEEQHRLEVALHQERRCSGKLSAQVEELSSELEELQKQLPTTQAQELLQESLRRMAAAEGRCDELLAELNDERSRETQLQQQLQVLEQETAKAQTDETQNRLQHELEEVSRQLLDAEANRQRLQQLLRDGEAERNELTWQLEDLRKQCDEKVGQHQQQTSEALQQVDELRSALAAERETKAMLVAQLDGAAPQLDAAPPPEGSLDLQQEIMEASLQRLASAEHREEELQTALHEALQVERESKLLAHAQGKAREQELSQELDKVLSVKQQLEAQLAAAAQENEAMAGEAKESLAILASTAAQWKDAQQALQKEKQEKLVLQVRLDELQHELSMMLRSQFEEPAQVALQLKEAIARAADAEADREELARHVAQAQKDLDEAQERQCEAEERCREMEGQLLRAEVGDYSMDALEANNQKAWKVVRSLQDEVQRAIQQKTKVELEKDELEEQLETSQDEVQRAIQQRNQAELQRDECGEQLERLRQELEAAKARYQLCSETKKPIMFEVALLEDPSDQPPRPVASSMDSKPIRQDLDRKHQVKEHTCNDLEDFEQRRRWRSSDEEQLVHAQRQQEESLDELRAALARLGTGPGDEAVAGHPEADLKGEVLVVAKSFVVGLTKQVKLQLELQRERESTQTMLARMATQLQPRHVDAEESQEETAAGNADASMSWSLCLNGKQLPEVETSFSGEAEAAVDLVKSAQAFLLARGIAPAKQGRKQRQPSSEHKRVRMYSEADTEICGEDAVRAHDASDVLAAAKAFSRGFEDAGYFRNLGSGSPDVFSASLRSEFWAAPPGARSRLQSCDLSECMSIADSLLQPSPKDGQGHAAEYDEQAQIDEVQQGIPARSQLGHLYTRAAEKHGEMISCGDAKGNSQESAVLSDPCISLEKLAGEGLLPGVLKRNHEPRHPNLLAQRSNSGPGWPNLLSKPTLEEKLTVLEKVQLEAGDTENLKLLQERWTQEHHSNMILSSRLAGLQQELTSVSAQRNDFAKLAEHLQQQLQGAQWQLSAAEAKQEELLQLWQEDLAGTMSECR